jgi:hypothetical protein
MEWKILNRTETINKQSYYDYDEEGNAIDGTETIVDYKLVNTEVEYTIDGNIIVVEVNHFNPQSEDDIELGINNMGVTQKRKLENN